MVTWNIIYMYNIMCEISKATVRTGDGWRTTRGGEGSTRACVVGGGGRGGEGGARMCKYKSTKVRERSVDPP